MELRRSVITEETCARTAIMADRTTLGPPRGPTARTAGVPSRPSARLPSPANQRPDHLRQAPANCCASAVLTRRLPTRRARPPRSATVATSGSDSVSSPGSSASHWSPRTGTSASSLTRSPSTARSPRLPEAARSQDARRSARQTGPATPGHDGWIWHSAGPCPGRCQLPRHSPLLAPTLDRLGDLGPLPDDISRGTRPHGQPPRSKSGFLPRVPMGCPISTVQPEPSSISCR